MSPFAEFVAGARGRPQLRQHPLLIWLWCCNPLLFPTVVYYFNRHPPFHHPSHTHSLKWSSLPLPGGLPASKCTTQLSNCLDSEWIPGFIFQFRARPWKWKVVGTHNNTSHKNKICVIKCTISEKLLIEQRWGGEGKFFDLIDTSKSHSDCFYVENLLVSEIKLNKWNYSKCEK